MYFGTACVKVPSFFLQDGAVLTLVGTSGHCNIPTQQWDLFVPYTAAVSSGITRGYFCIAVLKGLQHLFGFSVCCFFNLKTQTWSLHTPFAVAVLYQRCMNHVRSNLPPKLTSDKFYFPIILTITFSAALGTF